MMRLSYVLKDDKRTTLCFNHAQYVINGGLTSYLNTLCLSYGSNLQGVIDSFNYYYPAIQKTPLVISLEDELILFPLVSLKQNQNILINYFDINSIKKQSNYQTIVHFKSGHFVVVDYNIRSIRRQISRIQDYCTLRQKTTYLSQLLCYNLK